MSKLFIAYGVSYKTVGVTGNIFYIIPTGF